MAPNNSARCDIDLSPATIIDAFIALACWIFWIKVNHRREFA